MRHSRHSGILLPPTSLPGPHGSGDLGASSRHFVDWLAAGAQTLWQILPLGGTGPGNSPYMSPSAFAGNELLIDLIDLRDAGWLTDSDVAPDPMFRNNRVEFNVIRPYRMARLRLAAERFFADVHAARSKDFHSYCQAEQIWLDDYALFMALDTKLATRGHVWQDLPPELAARKPKALKEAAVSLASECNFWKFCQWRFDTQWNALRNYANARGIHIVGDIPIFVSAHSADVWAHQSLFDLRRDGHPRVVAGVPPDYFCADGQLWGNPLYRWSEHAKDNYRWWRQRIEHAFRRCDAIRIDHFRGFESYWEIPADAATAAAGRWSPGPGADLFDALGDIPELAAARRTGEIKIVAEDLGVITPEVAKLRHAAHLPGMRILQFAFDGHADNPYLPYNFDPRTVVYTGTHDNDTTCGWWKSLPAEQQDRVRRYLCVSGEAIHWDLIRAATGSVAAWAILPMQDILGLDSQARMNLPGVSNGCWAWRFTWSQVEPWHAERLAELTCLYGREGTHPPKNGVAANIQTT